MSIIKKIKNIKFIKNMSAMSAMSATCTPVVFSVNTTRIQRANDPYSGFKTNVISIHDESNV